VRDLVPSSLARLSPGFGLLAMIDTPTHGELALDLSNGGDLKTAHLAVDLERGFVRLPSVPDTPILLESGRVAMLYDAGARRLDISSADLDWGGSRMTLKGEVTSNPEEAGEPQWRYALEATEGVLSAT